MTGTTTTLCVRRATYWDEEMGKEDPAKKGVCSNYLCDANPGMKLKLTGPSGKVMLMPEDKPETDLIMIATGTGIAPYRSFARRLFAEATPAKEAYKGQAWLFLGVANSDALLYDAEWQQILKEFPDNFRLDYALSREQQNKDGGKMYIQDKVSFARCVLSCALRGFVIVAGLLLWLLRQEERVARVSCCCCVVVDIACLDLECCTDEKKSMIVSPLVASSRPFRKLPLLCC